MGSCSSLPALLGVGGNLVDDELDSVQARTFDHPMEIVRAVVVTSLVELGLDVQAIDRRGRKQHIAARSDARVVEVELEPVARAGTWVQVMARDGLDVDGATARWVLRNAAKILESAETS